MEIKKRGNVLGLMRGWCDAHVAIEGVLDSMIDRLFLRDGETVGNTKSYT
jgi:hypothetical protein